MLGVRVLRYSGVQGVAMVGASVLHLVTIFVVAAFLGPSELGRFAILYFGANLLAQVLTIAVKPGTIRRTFGEGDDEDDDEDDEDVSDDAEAQPRHRACCWPGSSPSSAAVVAIVLREPIAEWLLGDSGDARPDHLGGASWARPPSSSGSPRS